MLTFMQAETLNTQGVGGRGLIAPRSADAQPLKWQLGEFMDLS